MIIDNGIQIIIRTLTMAYASTNLPPRHILSNTPPKLPVANVPTQAKALARVYYHYLTTYQIYNYQFGSRRMQIGFVLVQSLRRGITAYRLMIPSLNVASKSLVMVARLGQRRVFKDCQIRRRYRLLQLVERIWAFTTLTTVSIIFMQTMI